jgi:hypothetical protein
MLLGGALAGLLAAATMARAFGEDTLRPLLSTDPPEVLKLNHDFNLRVLADQKQRQIDDIVVPGSIGKYPLKMTRYYNSRGIGDGWSHEYEWGSHNGKVSYPNGNVWDNHCTDFWGLSEGPLGVSDWPTTWNGYPAFRLGDGGTVVFGSTQWPFRATKIIDPYGQGSSRTRGREVRARRLLLGDGDAVLQVDDHLVRVEAGRLCEHLRARRRNDEARAAEPHEHARTLTLSLHGRYGPLTRLPYSRRMDTSGSGLRLIVALIGALTVLLLVLPIHP